MKIAVFTEFFYPHIGGQERRYLELSRRLVAKGNRITIYTIKYSTQLPKEETVEGIEVRRYAATSAYAMPNFRNPIGVLKFALASACRAMERDDFDFCIFNQWPICHIPLAEPFCKNATVVDWCETWPGLAPMAVWRYVARFPDGHTVVDQHIEDILRYRLKVDPARIAEIRSGVNTGEYVNSPSNKEKGRIICVGRLMPHKRLDLLIEAVRLVAKSGIRVGVDIVGGGPSYSSLKTMATPISDVVSFHGQTSEMLKVSLLKKAWLMVIPSKREGVPVAAIEAMAAGVPLLTTNSPANGTQHLVKRHNIGIVTDPNPCAIASAIVSLYNDEGTMAALSENCLRAKAQYDWDRIADDLEIFLARKSDLWHAA